jgi:[ribosomal protein S5]-alanine N-acetyltransferase
LKNKEKLRSDDMYKIYEKCPVFRNEKVILRLTNEEDTLELLNCYSDDKAVPFFNADNCGGDIFYYTTVERMKQAVDMWKWSFETKQFVRMTIILSDKNEKIGTIEMFNRGVAPFYGVHGILRLDIMSKYENEEVIGDVLQLANTHFYKEFGVEWIATKAIGSAMERKKALTKLGYVPMEDFALKDYYGRIEDEN